MQESGKEEKLEWAENQDEKDKVQRDNFTCLVFSQLLIRLESLPQDQ